MYKLIRYIRHNKTKVLITVGMIVGVLIVIQVLNRIAGYQLEQNSKIENESNTANTSKIYQPNKTIISNTSVSEKEAEDNTKTIDKFVEFCNKGDTKSAYDMLTDECKENMFKNIDFFIDNYYKTIFTEKKNYNIQSWITYGDNYTYKIRYTEDLLATGKSNDNVIEDFITIVEGEKLNINNFIMREKIEKKRESQNIAINIKYKNIYKNYEEYMFEVTNNTEKLVLLDSLKESSTVKLIGENDVEYQALTNELSKYDVSIPPQNTKNVKIRFTKEYNPRRKIKEIIFTDIILDTENKEDKTNMEIEI